MAQKHLSEIGPLWSPKADIRPEQKVVTFGSCFAQHIGMALQKRGFCWHRTEPPPAMLSGPDIKKFNYDIFSCRTANIYTTTLLLQWTRWALLDEAPPPEVWEKDGNFFDPFRPTIEPQGFVSAEELRAMRGVTIRAFAEAIRSADVFVFTLGLTESWWNRTFNYEYPMCPGTPAGTFDPEQHEFRNVNIIELLKTLAAALDLMKRVNRDLRVILTVSPVPLTATNSGNHVLVATTEAKSILRTAAAHMSRYRPYVDYFPSYEIISSPPMRGVFFGPNLRDVSQMGVDFVMDHFFSCLRGKYGGAQAPQRAPAQPQPLPQPPSVSRSAQDVICEEELLDAFGPASQAAQG